MSEAFRHQVEVRTRLGAPAERVWARAVTPFGINDELRPVLRMTMPPRLRGRTIADVPVGEPLGRSWLLLGGVLPVDFDELRLEAVGPGMRFQEDSRMLTMRRWRHEREVVPWGEGSCEVVDRLGFELRRPLRRLPGAEATARAIVRGLFRHRHRRLAGHWARHQPAPQ